MNIASDPTVNLIVNIVFYVIFVSVGMFGGAFIKTSAQNLATKKFSKKMEEILQQNRIIIEQYKNINQLRMAALDKRLEVHQQAYTLWDNMRRHVHDNENIMSKVSDCQTWWLNNCLYLSGESREAFWQSYNAASRHGEILDEKQYTEEAERKELSKKINDNWEKIIRIGEILVKSVELPPIKADIPEKEEVKEDLT